MRGNFKNFEKPYFEKPFKLAEVRTAKEAILDRIEQRLGGFTDEVYLDLKKLTLPTLKILDDRL